MEKEECNRCDLLSPIERGRSEKEGLGQLGNHDELNRQGGSSSRYLFLTVLEPRKFEIKVLADLVSSETPLGTDNLWSPLCWDRVLLCSPS